MSRTYKLGGCRPALDRDALLRALLRLDLRSFAQRWRACLVIQDACRDAETGDDWLWAYGLHAAMAGQELPPGVGPRSCLAEGYQAGSELLPLGTPLVIGWPLGQRRAIGSRSPGRCWLN